ncbi:MAG: hypothetical protein ACTSYD_05135, partial [Candidatus Heimdallarchaeaceae archaeon]
NGTVEITFTAHNCSALRPLYLGNFAKLETKSDLGLIIGVSIGGALLISVMVVIIVKLARPKKR